MKQLWKEIKKPFWKILCRVFPLLLAAWALGLHIYYYYFAHSYAQSCVWAVWCTFAIVAYKIKQYDL